MLLGPAGTSDPSRPSAPSASATGVAVGSGIANRPSARRLIVVLVTVALAVTLTARHVYASSTTFNDVRGSVYEAAVNALASRDILLGCGNGGYCPTDPIRRDQLAAVLYRALDLPEATRDHFTDVEGNPHAAAINAVAEAGFLRGYGDTYRPGEVTQRGQIATVLDRIFEPAPTSETYFSDSGHHAEAIDRIAAAGITAGCARSLTAFCATDLVNRGQFALFLARAMDLVDRSEVMTLDERLAEEEARREAERQAQLAAAPAYDPVWDRIAQCESGGNWSINTGNGYYGGLQFSLSSWRWVGGSGYPHQADKLEQIRRGEMLLARQGWGAWPACSRKLGLR